jgi:hypothetical protein
VLWARLDVVVADRDIAGLQLSMKPGPRVSGKVTLEGMTPEESAFLSRGIQVGIYVASGRPPLATNSLDPSLPMTSIEVGRDGTFSVQVPPDTYVFRVPSGSVGFSGGVEWGFGGYDGEVDRHWALSSVEANGRNVADEPIRIHEDIADVAIRLTDKSARVEGRLHWQQGAHSTGATVVIFPTARTLWQDYGWQAEWRVRQRPVLEDRYSLRGLPPGEYYLTAIDDDLPRQSLSVDFLAQLSRAAVTITLSAGDRRLQDLEARPVR